MSHTPAEDLDRITDYVSGDLSPEEIAETERWIAEDGERQELVRYLQQSRDVLRGGRQERIDMKRLLLRVAHRIQSSQNEMAGLGRHTLRDRTGRFEVRAFRGISAVGGIAIAAVAIFLVHPQWLARRSMPDRNETTYATTVGQLATFTLPDSSHVTLAPNTIMRVARTFGTGDRVVTLLGEARFDVTAGVRIPFRVQTGSVTTNVLGTTFAVRRYAADRVTRVAVVSGKVSVATSQHTPFTLNAGMVGEVNDSIVTTTAVGDVAPYVSWTSGRLDFREAPVADVLTTLERWYGIEFHLTDPAIGRRRITAVLDFTATTDLVYALETLLNVSASSAPTQTGTVIILRPRHPASRGSSALDGESVRRVISSFPSEVGR